MSANLNLLDIILLILIIIAVIGGVKKGFFRALFDVVGVIVSLILTYFYYGLLETQLLAIPKFINSINGFFVNSSGWFMNVIDNSQLDFFMKLTGGLSIDQAASNHVLTSEDLLSMFADTMTTITVRLISVILTFLVIYFILLIIFAILNKIMEVPGLNVLNRIGGGIVGFLKASIIIFVALSLLVPLVRTIAPEEEVAIEDRNFFYSLTTSIDDSQIVAIALGDKSIVNSISDGFGFDIKELINDAIKLNSNENTNEDKNTDE